MATRDKLGWSPSDYDALLKTATRLGMEPAWLMAVMYSESTMDPSVKNALGYRGLISLGTSELRGMGLSPAQIDRFTSLRPLQQMPFVERYFAFWAPPGGWTSRAQIYQAGFLPATVKALGSAPSLVLARKPADGCPKAGNNFCANSIFSRDGKTITVADLDAAIEAKLTAPWSKWQTALDGLAASEERLTAMASPDSAEAPAASVPWAPAPPASPALVPVALSATGSREPAGQSFAAALLLTSAALGAAGYLLLQTQCRPTTAR